MTVSMGDALRDARALWTRDRATLLRIAGPFLFLPAFASLLLLPETVLPRGATQEQAQAAMFVWIGANAHWIALRLLIDLFGAAVLFGYYLDRGHRTLGEVLARALALFPSYLAAALIGLALIFGGMLAFVVPGLYAVGRLTMVSPAITAERLRDPRVGIARSIALTRGHGWVLAGVVAATVLLGYFVSALLLRVEDAMILANAANPVSVAIVDGLAAAVATLTTLARVLIMVALYRRLSTRQGK